MYGMDLHINYDEIVLDPAKRKDLITHWDFVYPKVVNGYTTSRLDLTIAWLKDLHTRYPKTIWVLRLMPDNGQDTHMAYDAIYARHKPVFEQIPWVKMLAGNESSFDSIAGVKAFAENTARLLKLAGDKGHGYIYYRFPMGNPDDGGKGENHYPHLIPGFEAAAAFGDLHGFGPNEYLRRPGDYGGLVGRYRLAWKACEEAGIARPWTHIGEFGLALDSDPEAGWRSAGSGVNSEEDYIGRVLEPVYRAEYALYDVPVSVFMYPPGVAPWDKLAIGSAGLSALRTAAKTHPDAPVTVTPKPEPEKPRLPADMNPGVEDPRWKAATAQKRGAGTTLVRLSPSIHSEKVGQLYEPLPYKIKVIPREDMTEIEQDRSMDSPNFWWLVKLWDDKVGWIRSDVVTIVFAADEKPPETTPDADKPSDRDYAMKMIAIHQMRQAAFEALAQAEAMHLNLIRSMIGEEVQSA